MATCFERLKEIAKGSYSDEELRQILKNTENELAEKENLAEASGSGLQDVINNSTAQLEKSAEQETFRLSMEELQVARSADLFKNFEQLQKNPLKRFGESLTIGTRVGVKGAGARMIATHSHFMRMSGRINLDKAIDSVKDGTALVKSSQYEDTVLDAINGKTTNNEIANKVGKNIRDFRESNLKEMEKHGIVIKRLKDRGIYQSHNAEEMLKLGDTLIERSKILLANIGEVNRAGKLKDISLNRWKGIIDPLLDLNRTFGEFTATNEKEKNRIYREIFDTITSDATSIGKSSVQSKVGAERFFHFKDSKSQLAYNRQFGSKTLYDSLMQEADSSWNNIATLQLAGNRPLNYIDKTIRLAARNAKRDFTKTEVNRAVDEAKYSMQQAMGISTTVHGMSGKLVNAIKLALLAKIVPTLGPLVLFADVAPAINVMAQLGGRGTFRSTVKLFGILKKVLANEKILQDYVQSMGLKRDIQIGSIHKFSGIENANLRGKLATVMMKFSPHELMNYVESLSVAHELTLMLGQHSKVSFDKLPGTLSKVLNLYGIEGDRWNLMRKGTVEIGGYTHITSDALRNVDKENIKTFLKKKFNLKKVSDFRIEQEREQTQQLFTQMITDKMVTGSNLVDARQRSFWSIPFDLNNDKGRKAANLFSIFGSLRYYETAIVQRTLAPLIFGETGESVMHQIIGRKFDKIGLARWSAISFTTALMAFTLQDLMSGKEPDPTEVLTRALMAPLGALGQGLEVGKGFGHDAARSAFGPGFNMLFDSVTDLAKVMRFDHPAKNALNFVKTAIPGFNNRISRNAINHLTQDQYGNMNRG